jgi:hypothetical protein
MAKFDKEDMGELKKLGAKKFAKKEMMEAKAAKKSVFPPKKKKK